MAIWYCITEIFNDDNTINKAITDVIEADERPKSTHECIKDKTGYKEVYKDWFSYHGTATIEELRAEIDLVNSQQRVKYIGQECGSDVYLLTDDNTNEYSKDEQIKKLFDYIEDRLYWYCNYYKPSQDASRYINGYEEGNKKGVIKGLTLVRQFLIDEKMIVFDKEGEKNE